MYYVDVLCLTIALDTQGISKKILTKKKTKLYIIHYYMYKFPYMFLTVSIE